MMLGKRGALRVLSFFLHISNSIAGAAMGCRVLPAPRRAPYNLPHFAAGGTGYWNAHQKKDVCNYRNTRRKTTENDIIRER